jgi:hypothetical protein
MTSISGITEASSILSYGRKIYFIPSSRANIAAGRAHCMGRMIPSSASSPRKSDFSRNSLRNSISLPSMPRAIGRS